MFHGIQSSKEIIMKIIIIVELKNIANIIENNIWSMVQNIRSLCELYMILRKKEKW